MDWILNNKVSDIVFGDTLSLSAGIIFLVLIVVVFFLYDILYKDGESMYFKELGKVGLVSFITTASMLWLYDTKNSQVSDNTEYETLIDVPIEI